VPDERPPEYWQSRAEEARTMAGNTRHADTRETLLKIAEGYERLANGAQAKRKPSTGR